MSGSVGPPSVAVVTSRLARLVIPDQAWLVGLRAVLREVATNGARLLIAEGTAGSDFVRHAAIRLGIPFSELAIPENVAAADDIPLRDRIVIESADIVYVLQLRSNGNIHRLLRERIEIKRDRLLLVDLPGLQSEAAKDELCRLGAVKWKPDDQLTRPLEVSSDSLPNMRPEVCHDLHSAHSGVYSIDPCPAADGGEFLVHTTRSCPGPWPDESFGQYADSLLESRSYADHSALGALRRIVRQRQLIASNRTIRGGSRVVSFTACPLINLPELNRFRTHRVRWDFEPYGLGLRRDWLIDRGVRPVRYATDEEWDALSDQERPFFQLATGESGIDWTVEQEWRGLGNLSFDGVDSDDVILFVPDFESAKSLSRVTSWPITLWPGAQ